MLIGFVLGIVFSIVVAVVGAFLTVISGWIPANADAKPGWPEKYAAHNSLRATLAADSPKGPNPVAATDANLIEGFHLYAAHCAICHGSAEGKSAELAIAKGEYPEPPQLASNGVEDDPEGWTFRKIAAWNPLDRHAGVEIRTTCWWDKRRKRRRRFATFSFN